MRRQNLTAGEIRMVGSAGAASLVLMLVVWLVQPRLDALVFSSGGELPVVVQWFRQCYRIWPFILIAAAVAAVLLGQFPPGSLWRRGLIVLEAVLAALAVALIVLAILALHIPVLMLPAAV